MPPRKRGGNVPPVSEAELAAEGVTTTVPFAGRCLDMSRETAYDRAKTGELAPGVPVIRVGARYVVPTAPLRRVLGMEHVVGGTAA